jgi:hypothetical protein
MGFKFLKSKEVPDQPDHITQERFNELVQHQLQPEYLRLTTDNRPAVFLNLMRNRNDIDETEWTQILRRQRIDLIEYMWEQGMVSHTIISQDEFGFTLRTEINF